MSGFYFLHNLICLVPFFWALHASLLLIALSENILSNMIQFNSLFDGVIGACEKLFLCVYIDPGYFEI